VLVPVLLVGSRFSKLWAAIVSAPFFIVGYYYSLQDSLQTKAQHAVIGYIQTGYSSSGAGIRIAMNALPAFLYFVFRSRIKIDGDERRFLDVLALVALAFVGLLYVSPSSTAVDRMALYIIPVQLLVLGRLPLALARTTADYKLLATGIVVYSAVVMFVWLNFAVDAGAWVPYSLIDVDRLVGLSY
jgi:EpsG family